MRNRPCLPLSRQQFGLILCKDRNNVIAQYALHDIDKPIGISCYKLAARLPEELKTSLPAMEEVEAMLQVTGKS